MRRAQIAGGTLLAAALFATPAVGAPTSSDSRGWLGEEMPLPLAVKTPQDLAVKAAAERQYLIFNLLAGGKLAWDAGDFATAATKWEALLKIRGLAREARARAGEQPAAPAPPTSEEAPPGGAAPASGRGGAAAVSVSGTIG